MLATVVLGVEAEELALEWSTNIEAPDLEAQQKSRVASNGESLQD